MRAAILTRALLPAAALLVASAAAAQPPSPENYEDAYRRYLASARAVPADGSVSIAWMTGLASDPRARALDDLVTVRVIENISASGTADSSLSKKGSGSVSATKLLGVETKLPGFLDPTSLVSVGGETDFAGGGTTVRTGALTATMTARVAEVLPSGDLVLEGAREIDINGDRQIVVLTGVVRPSDITRQNVVLSTHIGQLRIRYFGRGLMKDNLQPGWLIRILNKIF